MAECYVSVPPCLISTFFNLKSKLFNTEMRGNVCELSPVRDNQNEKLGKNISEFINQHNLL